MNYLVWIVEDKAIKAMVVAENWEEAVRIVNASSEQSFITTVWLNAPVQYVSSTDGLSEMGLLSQPGENHDQDKIM